MSKKLIAMIYEGEKTERILLNNLNQCFFDNFTELIPISFPAGENIYMLWKQLKADEFQTDIIEVLREYNETAARKLEGYSRKDFMEIYLFFDFDGHANNIQERNDSLEVLYEMLDTFSDETEFGKLYINYPMVESIRDNIETERCYRHCSISIRGAEDYKRMIHEMTQENKELKYQDFRKYDKDAWSIFCKNAIKKWNCIMNDTYKIPERNVFLKNMEQRKILEQQEKKFIIDGKVAIINSFPLFILEYFKEEFWIEMLSL